MQQALHSTRPGGNVGFVGVPHGVQVNGEELFYSHAGLRGGPPPSGGSCPTSSPGCWTAGSTRARCST